MTRTDTLHASLLALAAAIVAVAASLLSSCTTPTVGTEPVPYASPSPVPGITGCCPQVWPGTRDGAVHQQVRSTSYFPDSSALEGGFVDRKGNPLKTLQAFLAGKADAVTVAMDSAVAPYATKLCSPTLNAAYGASIPLELKDTGGAFKDKAWQRLDFCSGSRHESLDSRLNRNQVVIECH